MSRRRMYADLFCGGGGTSTGLAQAAAERGQEYDLVAINHDEVAVATHARNHPEAQHYCQSINSLDPLDLVPGGALDLLVASPECTHFSAARRGGKPCSKQSRAGAYHVLDWCNRLDVRNVLIENVPQFKDWGPLDQHNKPIKRFKGRQFRDFLRTLRGMGYRVQVREKIVCADYGDATTRKRLFVVATKDRRVSWPAETHAKDPAKASEEMFAGERLPWRTAREVIDFNIPSQSIFERKRPLSDKTMARIAEGLRRYCGASFVVPRFGERERQAPRTHSIDRPLPTINTTNQHHLVTPFLVKYYGTAHGQSIDVPLDTVTAKARFGLVEPFLIQLTHGGRTRSIDRPLPTITTANRGEIALIQPDGGKCLLDIRFRMLQPSELAAAMSFPEDYVFEGTKTEVTRQIGNAVPVRTAKALCGAAMDREAA